MLTVSLSLQCYRRATRSCLLRL